MSVPLEQRFGYFDAFMRAWANVDAETHATLYTEALEYEAAIFTPAEYVQLVSQQLGIASPVPA